MVIGKYFFIAAMLALLSACASAPKSYVVLLPSPDGTVGKVIVNSAQGEQVLTKAQQGAALNGSTAIFDVPAEKIQRDFGAAVAARPMLPEYFLLHFELGTTNLTDESINLLPTVIERVRTRAAPDISIIGHTDTLDKPSANELLGLRRAQVIAQRLKSLGLPNIAISIASHGQRDLLVPTREGVAEPRNRRVEITIR